MGGGDYSLLLAIKTFSGKGDLSHTHRAHQPTDPDVGLITLCPSVTCSDNLNPMCSVWSFYALYANLRMLATPGMRVLTCVSHVYIPPAADTTQR